MKRLHFFKLHVCAVAILAMIMVFAVSAAADTGDVNGAVLYQLDPSGANSAGVWGWNYWALSSTLDNSSSYYRTPEKLAKLYKTDGSGNKIDTGLRYDFDASEGLLTVYADPSVYDASAIMGMVWGWPSAYIKEWYPEGYFPRGGVKEIVIDVPNLKKLPEKSFNNFSSAVKITIPSTVYSLLNESLARLSSLETLVVAGSGLDADGVIDLRNISEFNTNYFTSLNTKGTHYVFISEKIADFDNPYFGNANGTGDIYIYTPEGYEECTWITSINRDREVKFGIHVVSSPSCRKISLLGYQVRTSDYNGLRAKFSYNENGANDGFTLAECGVIVGKASNIDANSYRLKKNAQNEYITSNASVKKLEISELNAAGGTFCVAIVNFSSKGQMNTPVVISGYEIWVDNRFGMEYQVFTFTEEACGATSLYDATLGMFRAGLINSSVEYDNTFWGALEGFNVNISHTITDAARAVSSYPYTIDSDGALIDKSNTNAKVYIFEGYDGKYTAIARGSGTLGGGTHSANYVRENYLSEAYIGVAIDTLIIDHGITEVKESATSGFSEYYNYNASDASKCADFHTSLTTIIYAQSVNAFTGQSFHSNFKMTTLVRFDPLKAGTDPNYVANSIGTADISTMPSSAVVADKFNRCKAITTLILPTVSSSVTIPARLVSGCSLLSRVYCAGGKEPDEGTADFSGTGYEFDFSGEKSNKVFESAPNIKTVVTGSGTYVRKSGNTWTEAE